MAADQIVYYVYHAPHINRLFLEDYVTYIGTSPFKILTVDATFGSKIPPHIQAELERLHPGRSHFRYSGLLAVLEKAA